MGYDRGNQISLEEYSKGFTLFAFDLTPDLDEGSHFHLVKQGNLRLELHFKTGLPQTINVIVYAEFDVIEIDKARNVLFDYSAWIPNNRHPSWLRILTLGQCFVGYILSIAFPLLGTEPMWSTRLLTIIREFIGWLCPRKGIASSILIIMVETLLPNCAVGARRNAGHVIPSLCKVLWLRSADNTVSTICSIMPGESISTLYWWTLELTWMTMTNWFMILWKMVTI